MTYDSFKQYKKELTKDKYNLLEKGQQEELYRKFKEEGDWNARELLINSVQRYIFRRAVKFWEDGLEHVDLIQEGNIGLIKAIEDYDIKRGTLFMTHARWKIRGAITSARKKERVKGFKCLGGREYPRVSSLQELIRAEKKKGKKDGKLGLESTLGIEYDFVGGIFQSILEDRLLLILNKVVKEIKNPEHNEVMKFVLLRNMRFDKFNKDEIKDKRYLNLDEISKKFNVSRPKICWIRDRYIPIIKKNSELRELYGESILD